MGEAPEPLVPIDADLRGLQFMPLDVVRLMDSDLFALSTGEEFKAAVAAWCKSWVQVPAGSLPDDNRVLAHLTGAGSRWNKVREIALRGFVKCSDGRLYHPVVCEKVREAWAMRLRQRERSAKGNASRWGAQYHPHGDPHGDPQKHVQHHRKGQGQGQGQEESEATPLPPADPVREVFDRGVAMLGASRRSLLGKFCKSHGEVAVLEALVACETECPVDSVSFFVACMSRAPPKNGHANQSPVTTLYEGAMRAADKLDRQEADRLSGIPLARTLLDGG